MRLLGQSNPLLKIVVSPIYIGPSTMLLHAHKKLLFKALHFLIAFSKPPQMLKKNNNEEVNVELATTTLLTKGKCTIPHILNFFQIISTINSSACLASSFNSKGTHNNLDNSPSFAHFQLESLVQSSLGFLFFW